MLDAMSQGELDLGVPDEAPREMAPGAWVLPGQVRAQGSAIATALQAVLAQSPWRQMKTPGGRKIQVSMSSCGELGWISDAKGYRYSAVDPLSQNPWPSIPSLFMDLAQEAAKQAGYPDFSPDSCLINRYQPGMTMGMHQDADEASDAHPIVSFSLGLEAAFRFGGARRGGPAQTLRLKDGDAVVWGGESRRCFHGISRVYPGVHPLWGEHRINLTFRRAG